jgi:hypothetical protein
MATGRPAAAVETGEDDIETSDFREHQSRGRLLANYRIRLLFAIGLFYRRAGLSSVLKLIATQDSRKLAMKKRSCENADTYLRHSQGRDGKQRFHSHALL